MTNIGGQNVWQFRIPTLKTSLSFPLHEGTLIEDDMLDEALTKYIAITS
jgi:hypothetical protein